MNTVGFCIYLGQQQERERVLAWLRLGVDPTDTESRISEEYLRLIDDIQEERHCEP